MEEQLGAPVEAAGRGGALSSARTVVVPTATTRSAACDRGHRRLGHAVALAVHPVLERIVGGDRLERVEADDELDLVHLDAALPDPLQQLGREVQPGRRRGRRTGPPA